MKKLLLALALLLLPSVASAQCNGIFANNTVCGNVSGAPNLPQAAPLSSFALGPAGTAGQIQTNNGASGFAAMPAMNGDCTLNTSTGAIACNSLFSTRVTTTNTTIQTSDSNKTVQVGTGSTGFLTVTLPAVAGFPEGFTVRVKNGDITRGKLMSGFPSGCVIGLILWPLQSCSVQIVNGAWQTVQPAGKWILQGQLDLYADLTGGGSDSLNDCLAAGASACLTITRAAAIFCSQILKNGQIVYIHMPSAHNQAENVSLCAYPPDEQLAQGTAPIITNDVGGAGGAIIPASGQPVTAVNTFTPWTFNQIVIQAPNTSTTCIEADINSFVYVGNATFYTCGIVLQSLYSGKIELLGGITLRSNVASVASSTAGGQFLSAGQAITCSGIGTVTTFAQATDNGYQNWTGTTFPSCGGVTGTKFVATTGGGIQTNSGGAAFFPGSVNGSPTSPGWYN